MRKVDPGDVVDDFKAQIDELAGYYDRVANALAGTNTEQSDISLLSEQTFVSAAVAFEGFFSDYFVGCVNRDSSAVTADFQNRFKQSVKEKFGGWIENRSDMSIPQHPSVEAVQSMLNPKGRNITFDDAADLKDKATKWLAVAHRNKVNALTVHDERLIDTAKAVRDFIAHRSVAAKTRMNDKLANIGAAGSPNGPLRRGANEIHNVGSFLKAVVQQPDQRRLHKFFERMKAIADSLK